MIREEGSQTEDTAGLFLYWEGATWRAAPHCPLSENLLSLSYGVLYEGCMVEYDGLNCWGHLEVRDPLYAPIGGSTWTTGRP
jgi:hypothetical protein